jgi:hypothetical protein
MLIAYVSMQGVTVAWSIYQKSISTDFTVVGDQLILYSDSAGTNAITTLHVGNLGLNTTNVIHVWVKNTGTQHNMYAMIAQGLPSGITVTWEYNHFIIDQNVLFDTTLTYRVALNAVLGAGSGTLVFTPE